MYIHKTKDYTPLVGLNVTVFFIKTDQNHDVNEWFVCLFLNEDLVSSFEMDKQPTVSYHTDTSYCPSGTVSLSFIPPDNFVLCDVA